MKKYTRKFYVYFCINYDVILVEDNNAARVDDFYTAK